ncbi:hypothetical protein [Nonomuraea helvata]|uniref:Nucleoside diphosphate kinase n=1 Tax=Nonomuraea helvata TaxID=37484 RepID=A0ABV5SC43_9ACTN
MSPTCDTAYLDLYDVRAAAALSHRLTSVQRKVDLYCAEAGYRAALSACGGTLTPDTEALVAAFRATGLVLIRPDAVRHGKTAGILAYYAKLGLYPFFCRPVQVTQAQLHEVWRYQLNAACGQRIRCMDLVLSAGPSVVALFAAGPCADVPVPVTTLLAESKGSADPGRRRGWELRSRLGADSRAVTYLHVADEPADVVRDGQLLLGAAGLRDALAAPRADRTDELADLAAGLRADVADTVVTDERDVAWGLCARPGPADRWPVLAAAGRLPADLWETPNLVDTSGSVAWWRGAGHEDRGAGYLQERLA